MDDQNWKQKLTPEQYRVLREKGTEFAFTGKYVNHHEDGMYRIEVLCQSCGGHLGHLFDDGPTETKKRFCINSAALEFQPSSHLR